MARQRTEYIDVRDVAQTACYGYDLDPEVCRAVYRAGSPRSGQGGMIRPSNRRQKYGFLLLTEEVEGSYKETYRVEGDELRDLLERHIMDPDNWRVKRAHRQGYKPERNPYHPGTRMAQRFERRRIESPAPPENKVVGDTIVLDDGGGHTEEHIGFNVGKKDLGTIEVLLRPKHPEERTDFDLDSDGNEELTDEAEEVIDSMIAGLDEEYGAERSDDAIVTVEGEGHLTTSQRRDVVGYAAGVGALFLLFAWMVPVGAARVVATLSITLYVALTYRRYIHHRNQSDE